MRIYSVLICAVILSSCASVPDNVRSRTEESRSEMLPQTGLEFVDVSMVEDDIKSALKTNLSQFSIRSGLTVYLPDEYIEYDFIQAENYQEKFEEIAPAIFDDNLLSQIIVEDMPFIDDISAGPSSTYTSPTRGFRSDELESHLFVHSSGFLAFYRPSAFDVPEEETTVVSYIADRGQELSDSYIIGEKPVTVSDAIEFSQKWLDNVYSGYEPDYTFKVYAVNVKKDPADNYSYELYASKAYKGIMLQDHVNVQTVEENMPAYMKYISKNIMLQIRSPEEISMMTNGNGVVLPKENHKLERIVSLSSALNYISGTFADMYAKMEISDIRLAYSLSPEYDYEKGMSYFHPGIINKGRLVWEFLINVPDKSSGFEIYKEKYITIDVETGELEYDFDP